MPSQIFQPYRVAVRPSALQGKHLLRGHHLPFFCHPVPLSTGDKMGATCAIAASWRAKVFSWSSTQFDAHIAGGHLIERIGQRGRRARGFAPVVYARTKASLSRVDGVFVYYARVLVQLRQRQHRLSYAGDRTSLSLS